MQRFRLALFRRKFRKRFPISLTWPTSIFDLDKVNIGEYSYGPLNIMTWNNSEESIEIGRFVSIANEVIFMLGGNHPFHNVSQYPYGKKLEIWAEDIPWTKGKIVIGDDVWIGTRAVILSGVNIGQGAVVGAGCIVNKHVPPYAIVGGNPMRIIKYRFSPEIIEAMVNNIDYNKIVKRNLPEIVSYLYQSPTLEMIYELGSKLSNSDEPIRNKP